MATNTIKGLTVEIGGDTTKLGKALEDVNKRGRDLSSELGQINKLLKLDPTNTELLAQKQKVLADAISNTEAKLDTLREAEKQVQEQFERGEVSEAQYRELQREIIATEKKLDSYKKAAKDAAGASDDLADGAEDAAEELEDTEKEAEDAEGALDDLKGSLADTAKNGFTALAGAAAAAITAVAGLAEATREYRTAMGKLDTAFKDNGHSAETAYETYSELQGVLGDTDKALEAATLLSGMCETEEELAEWNEILTGAYAKFGDSLPVEGLAEAANETVRTGKVTGNLADALNWATEEGEMFGLQLKEQIKFTELSNEELKKLSKKKREAYEVEKRRYDSIEEWNNAILEATTAEDKFNIALEQCTTEQERQQLITKYLTKTYKSAATQYKKTNKEVIRANEANEEWNKTLAEIGAEMEPVVTDIKEMGIALLKDAKEPLKQVATFVRDTFLPALTKTGNWIKSNLPQIASILGALTATVVLYKAAVVSSELATKGLTLATIAQQTAQKALNLVMNANPYLLVAAAVGTLITVFAAFELATKSAKEPVDALTKEERELMAAADEAAESFREQKKATDEALGNITASMTNTQNLANELLGLADASGKVKEKDQERANFILNELNTALGTEYTMVDGVIQKYDELQGSIHEVIQAKLANSLVEAANADYVAAIQGEAEALKNLTLKEKDYEAQKVREQEALEKLMIVEEEWLQAKLSGNAVWIENATYAYEEADRIHNKESKLLWDKKDEYDKAAVTYGNYYNTIANYEEAQAAVLAGNYELAVDILSKKGGAFGDYSDKVDEETAKVLDTLFKEAVDAGLEAERTKKNFENGVKGYTEGMVNEADLKYKEAMRKFQTAYADAESVGEDVGDGFAGGMENKRSGLLKKAKSLVTGVINAMRREADSHSPARKTIDFGEDVGEGAEIGIENKTADVARAGQRQAEALLDAYGSQELEGQNALRSVAERQAARQTNSQIALAAGNSDMLGRILAAIEKGQVLLLDGDALVGGTAGKMDTTLGQRRALVELGAL